MRPLVPSALLAAALALAPLRAAADTADPLAAVPAKIDGLDFVGAEAALDAALRSGGLSPRDLARAFVYRGVLAASKKDGARAEREFARALRIDPAVALPVGVAPHVAAPFERAKGAGAPPVDARIGLGATDARRALVVRVAVTGDPDHVARRVQVRAHGGVLEAPLVGDAAEVVVSAASHACAAVRVRVVDAFGNAVLESSDQVPRCAAESAPGAAHPAGSGADARPVPTYVWAGVAVTGALAATTGVLGLVALQKRSTFETANSDPARVADRTALHDSAASAEHVATIAAVATAVAGAVTVVLLVTRPTVTTQLAIGARPVAGGGVADVALRF